MKWLRLGIIGIITITGVTVWMVILVRGAAYYRQHVSSDPSKNWVNVQSADLECTRDGRLSSFSAGVLAELVKTLSVNPSDQVKLTAYAPGSQDEPFVRQNARVVRNLLIERGISDARIAIEVRVAPNSEKGMFQVTCDVQRKRD